jgi:hypothetical protein
MVFRWNDGDSLRLLRPLITDVLSMTKWHWLAGGIFSTAVLTASASKTLMWSALFGAPPEAKRDAPDDTFLKDQHSTAESGGLCDSDVFPRDPLSCDRSGKVHRR